MRVTITKFVQFFSLFLLLLVTGTFWGTWFTLTRSLEEFPLDEFIHIGKVIIANVAVPMRFIMPASILFMIAWVWMYPEKKSSGYYFSIAAVLLVVAALLVTLIVLVPMDNDIKTWTASTAPATWQEAQMRWKTFHEIRTFVSLGSFVCLTVSVINTTARGGH